MQDLASFPRGAATDPGTGLRIVVMGVAGCGKSVVAARLARGLGLPMVEGDAFHPAANVEKMRRGLPLGDADRAGWLEALAGQLALQGGGVVLTCSALKHAYRERLRAAAADLRFLHLRLTPEQARARVAARAGHFYPPSLVDTQFAALEDPSGEPGVVTVDGALPIDQVIAAALEQLGFGGTSSTIRNGLR